MKNRSFGFWAEILKDYFLVTYHGVYMIFQEDNGLAVCESRLQDIDTQAPPSFSHSLFTFLERFEDLDL